MKFKKFFRYIRNYNYLPLFLMLVLSITIHSSYAQNNNGIFFQAVARDNYSNPAKDRKIYVQSSIIQTSPSGVKVLIEEHQANTDAMGVFSISIGNGQRVGGTSTSITTIDWSKGPYYLNLKVSITPIGGNSSWDYTKEWIDMGTTSFGAVPFALYSASAAKVDDKLNITDTTKMLSVYAKALSVKTLETVVANKLTAADTLNMLKPYAKAAYTIDSNYFKTQLATKLSLADSTKIYVTPIQMAAYAIDSNFFKTQMATKLSLADSTTSYVTPTQLAAKTFDTTSLSNRINLKAVASEVTTSLNTKLNISDSTTSYVTPTQLAAKTFDTISLSNRIDLKSSSNEVVSSLNQKANATDVNSALSLKANASDLTAGLALKLDASKMGIANGVATLNGSGIIPSSQLPPVTLSSTNVVASDADMIALSSATVGSIAIRTDVNKNYVLSALPASTLGNWVELLTPAAPVQTVNGYTGVVSISKSDIGLGNVDNTTDAAKPVSTATQAALDLKLDASKVGVASGVASLNALGKIPTDQIPAISFSSVKVLSSDAEMLALSSAVVGSVVIRTDLNKNYVLAAANPSVLSNWIQLLTPAPPVQTVNGYTGNVTISKADLGLSDVNNTSDANKPISIATQAGLDAKANSADMTTALNLKSPLASPTFTGTVSIGTTHPSSSAALDISSTTQGLLLPRLTYLQKNAISSPEAGLLIWCSDCGTNGEMQVYNGTSFVNMIGNAAQFALPTINSTTTASSITSSAATSGGVISSDGGASITARGVVWGTSTAPTIALATKTTDGTGVGTYSSSITGLTSGTTYYVRAYATNSVGTKYGSEISFNTSAAVATLATTTAASSIGTTTAVSGGNIIYNGGATVTISGIVWSTSSTPTTALATKTTNGSATGTFTSSITGLTPGTLYYVRSYATNSVGTSYGAQTSFTTLNTATISATASVTSITSSTATSGGTITSDGGASVTSRGLVWGTSSGSSTYSVTSGTGTGTFTSSLTGLSNATTYYVRSFATNSVGTVYGTETSFTTLAIAPTVSATATATSITSNTATSGGTISSDGGASVTSRGLVWGTSSGASTYSVTSGTGTGTFTSSLTGLSPATTYYVRSFATNNIGTSYGAETSFTTLAIAPTVSATASVTSITSSTATSGGTITSDGGASVTSRGLVWGTSSGASTYSVTSGSGTGTFTSSLTGLSPATTYYVRSFATNSIGTSYGTETSFTTSAIVPTVSATATVTSITASTATSGGTITSDGGATVTSRGLVWGTTTGSSTYSVTSGTGTGTFTSSLTGLSPATTYYVRSFATNSIGTSYGAETSFTTLAIAPTVSATATVSSITGSTATSGGTITSDGGASVTSRGLVWGTTTGSSTYSVTSGTGTGTFTSSLTGLSPATTYYVRSFATNSIGTSYGAEVSFTTATTATLSSTISSTITSSTAILGGVLSSTGGVTTTIGIRYSTDINFGTYSTTIINANASAGTYTTTITGLSSLTTYYAKAYATNTVGTTLADAISFSTPAPPIAIGDSYGGGKVFYILQNGDNGYDANVQHGLIAATSDQGYAPWSNNNNLIGGGGTSLSIGSGSVNTTRIVSSQGNSGTYAAKIADDYVANGYSDWYLPSFEEMKKLIAQSAKVGGFVNGAYYWTSSESTSNGVSGGTALYAWIQLNPSSGPNESGKNYSSGVVRPIRSF